MRMMTLAVAAMIAAPAAAEVYKDWVPSKEVWAVSFVHVNPNRLDDYVKGLKQTWISTCEENKKQGAVLECSIFASETMANRDFNVMLVQKLPSAGVSDPDQARYDKVQAVLHAKLAQDKADTIISGYNEMRSFFGQQDFRRIDVK